MVREIGHRFREKDRVKTKTSEMLRKPNRSGPFVWIVALPALWFLGPTDSDAWNPCVRVEFSLYGLASYRGGRFHDLPVEMPTRMCQDRHRDRKPNEQQQEADRQDRRDDQSPQRHGERVRQHGPDGSLNRHRDPSIAVEKQGK